jgi:hypothetical protein
MPVFEVGYLFTFISGGAMGIYHKSLSGEKWNSLDISHQILNISAELNRARNRLSDNYEHTRLSLERALELIDLTIGDRIKWSKGRLRELLRFRDVVAEYYARESRSPDALKDLLGVLLRMHRSTAHVEW